MDYPRGIILRVGQYLGGGRGKTNCLGASCCRRQGGIKVRVRLSLFGVTTRVGGDNSWYSPVRIHRFTWVGFGGGGGGGIV